MENREERIDFVIPWVNGSDAAWRSEFTKYRQLCGCQANGSAPSDASEERYRDWGTLRYWFRGVERFAPWVGMVHLITWGHLPPWLDTSHPKLHVVRHTDYIPPQYLPTFNSCPIELNMHRIDGLSERFVYFNDDTFLCRPVGSDRFFRGGLPCDAARLAVIQGERAGHNILECMRVINRRHDKRKAIRHAAGKWFNRRYTPADILKTLSLMPWSFFPAFKDYHMPQPFLRSTLDTLWNEEGTELDATCRSRFRSTTDLSQWLVRYEQLATGRFAPVSMRDTLLTKLSDNSMDALRAAILSGRYSMICINDDNAIQDPASCRRALTATFDALLPDKSAYEL